MGAFLAVARGSRQPPKLIVLEHRGAKKKDERAGGPGGQGRHLRHRRHLAQARRRDGRDEVRHVRRGERARDDEGRRPDEAAAQRGRHHPGHREHARRQCRQARRHRHHDVRQDGGDPQYRRRGPPHPLRRPHLRRALQARRGRRHRHPHRRDGDRPGPRRHGALREQRSARPRTAARRRRVLGPRLAPAALGRLPGGRSSPTSPTSPTSARARAARSPRPASSSASPSPIRGRTWTSPAPHGSPAPRREPPAVPWRCSRTSSRGARRDAHRLLPLRRGQAALRLPAGGEGLRTATAGWWSIRGRSAGPRGLRPAALDVPVDPLRARTAAPPTPSPARRRSSSPSGEDRPAAPRRPAQPRRRMAALLRLVRAPARDRGAATRRTSSGPAAAIVFYRKRGYEIHVNAIAEA